MEQRDKRTVSTAEAALLARTPAVITPGHTFNSVTDTISHVVLTKRTLKDSATAYAQGGIAAALGAGDSTELHRIDTLAAGAALCDAAAVEVLVAEGPDRVRDLASAGAQFDTDPSGRFTLGKEAAHSRKRIVHAKGDQTGAEVARTLIARVTERKNIRVLETARALDLLVTAGRCCGVRAQSLPLPKQC